MQPKYAIGDSVFSAGAYWMPEKVPCPDCLGSAKWSVTTPAAETFEVRCHTCNEGWESSGKLRVYGYLPQIQALTIGSVRMDTADENPISYMCKETGIGSGTIHYEKTLFSSHEAACLYAKDLAAKYTLQKEQEQERERTSKKKDMVYKPKKTATK